MAVVQWDVGQGKIRSRETSSETNFITSGLLSLLEQYLQ